MLGGSIKGSSPDLNEVTPGNGIDLEKYNHLIERRLMPLFYYANKNAKKENQRALINIPGIGCGAFAGRFRGQMGKHLNQALQNVLKKQAKKLQQYRLCLFRSI